jgi:hypothetical protein
MACRTRELCTPTLSGAVHDARAQVEDQLVVVEKLLGRPNAPTIEARALNRQSTLARAVHAMQLLISFQEAYQFLWPVLRNKTVRESLPDAIRQFADVEDAWAFVYDWVAMKIPAMMVQTQSIASCVVVVHNAFDPNPDPYSTLL